MKISIGDIIEWVAYIFVAVIGIGTILWIIFGTDWSDLTDTKSAKSTTYTQQESGGHCSILADKCIVDEWSLKCLWFGCIVDGRGKE